MPKAATFGLKVLRQDDATCVFYLVWAEGKRDLIVSQAVPAELQRDYESWRRQYLRYYKLPLDQSTARSGSFSVMPNGDPSAMVRNAEDALITTFRDWLGAGDTREIERQLQLALMEAEQTRDEALEELSGVTVFLACDDRDLQRLPWETWVRKLVPQGLPPGAIRIIRTAKDDPQGFADRQFQDPLKKPRILAIVAEDDHLNTEGDWKVLRRLRSVAEVEKANWLPNDPSSVVTQKVLATIADDRGWDILFFAGHSDDQANARGSFRLTPTVDLSMNDVEETLETAQQQGLRLAVFNSCSGLAIAQSLTQCGVQSIVMRERIRSDAALTFLEPLCQGLRDYQDAQTAMLQACEALRSAEKIKFPSAHLIPSFFSPSRMLPYRIRPFGWRQQLRKWLPTKREIRAAAVVLLLGSVPVVNDALIEMRVGLQAVYRDLTGQIPELSENTVPPVHVIAVDQRALDMAGVTEAQPIPQAFLAELIAEIALYQPRTVGISYLLDDPDEGSSTLIDTMRAAYQEQGTWFVVNESAVRNLEVFNELRELDISLRGDSNFFRWDLDTPDDSDLENLCPFGYLMALAHTLNTDSAFGELPKFRERVSQEASDQSLDDNDFCRNIISLNDSLIPKERKTHRFINSNRSFYGWQSIIDFSLPSSFFYQRTLASNLLEESPLNLSSNIPASEQIFVVGAGDYADAEDHYSPPLALEYWWCFAVNSTPMQSTNQTERRNCIPRPRSFGSSEAYAYMASQLLQQHQVWVVPNYLMTGLAIIFSKATVLALQKQPQAKRKRNTRFLLFSVAGYGILCFQLYISVPVLLPILFPSTVLLNYLGPTIRRTF